MYIAKKRLKIGEEYREPGQAVPEATEFKNKDRLISAGFIELAWAPPEPQRQTEPEPEAETPKKAEKKANNS